MANLSGNKAQKLIFLLHSLIAVIKKNNTASWPLLIRAVDGKSAFIRFDDIYLFVSAKNIRQLQIDIYEVKPQKRVDFIITAEVAKAVISGQYLLDKAINEGMIFIRAPLEDLLEMHNLVLSILADGSIHQILLKLWLDFEKNWKTKKVDWKLEDQISTYGNFVNDPYIFLNSDSSFFDL